MVNPATRLSVDEMLKLEPHILHFIGHGRVRDEMGRDVRQIALVDNTLLNNADWLGAEQFIDLFNRHQPGVVLLQTCEGATSSDTDAFVGVASHVVQQNIPVVVAMQYEISNATAQCFSLKFYERLADNDPVDKAAQEGRRRIALSPDGYSTRDFATPVLFMRVKDGQLFLPPPRFNSQQIINTERAIELFRTLMAPSDHMRVLCLRGEGKMGKSHLLTKIFPVLAQGYHARYAILDLRYATDSIADILHSACSQLAPHAFTDYYHAHGNLAGQLSIEEVRYRNRHLTTQFARGVGELNTNPLLLLFDNVERADAGKQNWLVDKLLTELHTYSHVKVVLAGRSLPEVHLSNADFSSLIILSTIEDDQAYITYCRAINVSLGAQSVRDIARLCGYIPGIFADFVAGRYYSG